MDERTPTTPSSRSDGDRSLFPAVGAMSPLVAESTVNHSRHEIHQYPDTCLTCAEEYELCACPERCEIHG